MIAYQHPIWGFSLERPRYWQELHPSEIPPRLRSLSQTLLLALAEPSQWGGRNAIFLVMAERFNQERIPPDATVLRQYADDFFAAEHALEIRKVRREIHENSAPDGTVRFRAHYQTRLPQSRATLQFFITVIGKPHDARLFTLTCMIPEDEFGHVTSDCFQVSNSFMLHEEAAAQ